MTKLRTRYRIVFLYRELVKGKCEGTPLFYKLSGAVDGDAFNEYKEMAKEVYDTIPSKCILKDGSGVCIVTYQMKEPLKYKKFVKQDFIYNAKVTYVFTKRKNGVKIAYKVNPKTGKKTQTNYKKAIKNNRSQHARIRRSKVKFGITQAHRREMYDREKQQKMEIHRTTKKTVLKQFQMFQGCISKDMAYKGSGYS